MRYQRGFTLIELMIVVVIVGLLAVIAVPSYRQHVIKSNRAAAEGFMLKAANQQEQYMLDARQYATSLAALNLTAPAEVSRNYAVTVSANNAATPPSYTITATPNNASVDPTCGTLTLDQLGAKTPAAGCW